ncbi:hypothetical protein GALL_520920 [mine drainage metagenome]|uniref:Uncharacterized protein n=1 Tax=mine drainage metagenome TaxID=410659 RepID=A0A1J5PM07_9ZZZZ
MQRCWQQIGSTQLGHRPLGLAQLVAGPVLVALDILLLIANPVLFCFKLAVLALEIVVLGGFADVFVQLVFLAAQTFFQRIVVAL